MRWTASRPASSFDWRGLEGAELSRMQAAWRARVVGAMRDLDPAFVAGARRVLDAGCGFGALTWEMQKMWPDKEVVGVERYYRRAHVARRLPITVLFANMNRLPFPSGHFDLTFCLRAWAPPGATFQPPPGCRASEPYRYMGKATALADLARALAPGGRLVVQVWQDVAPESVGGYAYGRDGLRVVAFRSGEGREDSLVTLERQPRERSGA